MIPVSIPVRKGMSNSAFVLWFVGIFIVVFAIFSYFGIVPEGVREINATLFSLGSTEIDTTPIQIAGGTENGTSTSQDTTSPVVSTEIKDVPPAVAQVSPRVLAVAGNATQSSASATSYSNDGKVLPTHLSIAKIGVDTDILNPTGLSISVLDEALTHGGVRYPGSASLEEGGNMLLFGHSSRLKVIHNVAYKAFNGIGTLSVGDEIKVRSNTNAEYVYSVSKVTAVRADKEVVEFSASGRMLTLATCNSFGTKSDRFVVEAQFVRSYSLAK